MQSNIVNQDGTLFGIDTKEQAVVSYPAPITLTTTQLFNIAQRPVLSHRCQDIFNGCTDLRLGASKFAQHLIGPAAQEDPVRRCHGT